MKKKYLIGLIILVLVFTNVNYASASSDYREQLRKKWVESCINATQRMAAPSEKARLQFCQCSVDKAMAHYTVNELKKIRAIEKEMFFDSNEFNFKRRLTQKELMLLRDYGQNFSAAGQECRKSWPKKQDKIYINQKEMKK